MNKPKLIKPSAAEDAAIARGIAADPDSHEMSDAQFAEAVKQKRARGRPRADRPKQLVSLRIDADIVEAMRASGEGWQTRANDVLRQAFLSNQEANAHLDISSSLPAGRYFLLDASLGIQSVPVDVGAGEGQTMGHVLPMHHAKSNIRWSVDDATGALITAAFLRNHELTHWAHFLGTSTEHLREELEGHQPPSKQADLPDFVVPLFLK